MPDLTAQIRQLVARLSGAEAPRAATPAPASPAAPVPPTDPAPGLSTASLATFAALGVVVSLRSRSLDATVYLVPDDAAAARLVETGTPRHRCYTLGELAELAGLFTLAPPQRVGALRALDALREIFGDLDVVAVAPAPIPRPSSL